MNITTAPSSLGREINRKWQQDILQTGQGWGDTEGWEEGEGNPNLTPPCRVWRRNWDLRDHQVRLLTRLLVEADEETPSSCSGDLLDDTYLRPQPLLPPSPPIKKNTLLYMIHPLINPTPAATSWYWYWSWYFLISSACLLQVIGEYNNHWIP